MRDVFSRSLAGRTVFGFVSALLLWLCAAPLFAQRLVIEGDTPLLLAAARLTIDSEAGQLSAEGEVRALVGGWRLYADALAIDMTTGELVVTGHVRSDGQGGALSAETLLVDWRQGRLLVLNGDIRITRSPGADLRLQGARIQRLPDGRWELQSSTLTPCSCGKDISPSFSIRCEQVSVEPERQADIRDATLLIHDVPVFKLNHIVLPLSRRKSGLLAPHLGYSDPLGVRIRQDVFWAISEQADLTFGLEGLTARGVRPLLETRALSRNAHWRSDGFYLYDLAGDRPDTATNRFEAEVEQGWRPYKGVRQYARIRLLSDTRVPADFGWGWRQRDSDWVPSRVGISLQGSDYLLGAEAVYAQRLFESPAQDGWLWGSGNNPGGQLGPALVFVAPGVLAFDGRMQFAFGASLDNWWRSEENTGTVVGRRSLATLSPTLRGVVPLGAGLSLEPWVGWTHQSAFGETDALSAEQLGAARLGVDIASRFYRVFPLAGNRRLKHDIRPTIGWAYSPFSYGQTDGQGAVPPSDPYAPFVPTTHELTLGLEQGLAYADGKRRVDGLRLKLWQRLLLDDESRDVVGSVWDYGMLEADLDMGMASLRGVFGLDWQRKQLAQGATWLGVTAPLGLRFDAAYRFADGSRPLGLWRFQRIDDSYGRIHQVHLAPGWEYKNRVHLRYHIDLRLNDPDLIEQGGSLEFSGICRCWSIQLHALHRPPARVPDLWISLDLSHWISAR